MKVKPFLKWAGGKTQLIDEINKKLPTKIHNEPFTYIESFVGSGAVLFWMLNNFPNLENAIINDINKDLTDCYKTIKSNISELIKTLEKWQSEYYKISDKEDTKNGYYYEKRALFNSRNNTQTIQSALFIFLNKTCFNGLFRVNSKNGFNVPIGSYKKPLICDRDNLVNVSQILKRVTILNGDYKKTLKHAKNNTLFYLDPPYKPLSKTSSFNSYTKDRFDDSEQEKLKNFCDKIDDLGHSLLLSNSDVKEEGMDSSFFDDLYQQFTITRVDASRMINSNSSKRGKIKELLISNKRG